jgi:hypothetical protein
MSCTRALVVVAAVAAALLSVTGCGTGGSSGSGTMASATAEESNPLGDIPDNQVYVAYHPADGSFSVDVPEGWSRSDVADGVSYTDKLNTVTVQVRPGQPEPNRDTVLGNELAAIADSGRNVVIGTVETVTLPAGSAVHGTYAEDSAPDPVTGRVIRDDVELYVFWKDGTEVLVSLRGPHGADNVDPWKQISTSFSWQ